MRKLKLLTAVLAVIIILATVSVPVFAASINTDGAAPETDTNSTTDAGNEEAPKQSTWASILKLGVPIIILVAFFYFGMYRPQKKQEKEKKEMMDSMQVGASVTTNGGIMGRIVSIRDDDVTIESGADKTKFQIAKWAIVTVKKPGEEE